MIIKKPSQPLAVAHFRYKWFFPTETFLYNFIINYKETTPILIGCIRENETQFPVNCPVVTLYKSNTWVRWKYRVEHILTGKIPELHFDHSMTYRTLIEANVGMLHAHFGKTGYFLLPIKSRTDLPLITTFYGIDISVFPKDPLWQKRYAELFKNGDLFLVEGPFMQRQLAKIGCSPEKISIQRIGIGCELYPFRRRLPASNSRRIRILFCGSFREKKGLVYALQAVARAHEQFPNLEFYIIGDGEQREKIEFIIKRQRMTGYTHLLGFLSHKKVIEEMNTADIFIHPSVTAADGDSEGGAPTVILEAQACGLPILASYHADIPNIVVPGKSALLAPERDVDTLTKNLIYLLSDQAQWASFGTAGRSFVEQYHDIQNEVESLEKYYYQLEKSA